MKTIRREMIERLMREHDMSPDLAAEIVDALRRTWSSRGGKARAKRLSAAARRHIATLAASARWGK